MRRFCSPGVWIALLFLITGLPFLRQAGLHYDASYELACFYSCSPPIFGTHLFGHNIPLMILQYAGALKAWLYLPLLKFFVVTPFLVRLPSLIAGAGSVWLLFAILDRVGGRRAAIAGALLLATDATFLIATSYDFGPVALLHLSVLAAVFLVLRFETTEKSAYLAMAFFFFGLALWYKALAVWMLGGLVAASMAVFPRRILTLLSPARVAIAAVALSFGALPLIYYNAVTGGTTLHPGRIAAPSAPMSAKLLILRKTLEGSVFFSWLTEDGQPDTTLEPKRVGSKLSVGVSRAVGQFRSNWMLFAFVGSCCLLPWLWFTPARHASLFALIYLLVAWALMSILPETGAALHHAILLWPFPHFLMAVAGAQVVRSMSKQVAALMTALLITIAGCNVLLINNYYSELITRGTTPLWTDAVYPLFNYLASAPRGEVVAVDWGFGATLCLLSDGRMRMREISDRLLQPSEAQRRYVRSLMVRPGTLFVDYVDGAEQVAGVHGRVAQIAAEAGLRRDIVARVSDRNQRPRFEVARYSQATAPAPAAP